MADPRPNAERLTSSEYLAWYRACGDGLRRELVDGRVVTASAERARHAAVKLDVALALRRAVETASLDCTVFGDGMSIVVDEHDTWEPDAAVQCSPWDPDDVRLDNALIVVEVLSPSTGRVDAGAKLAGYLGLDSIRHYLIVDTERHVLIHHGKDADGTIGTDVHREGILGLDPPGLDVDVGACFVSLPAR